MSSTHMATTSMPMVSQRPSAAAISGLVPAPSLAVTSTGSSMPAGSAVTAPNEPMSVSTSGRNVLRACGASRRTASSPAAMLTPAAA